MPHVRGDEPPGERHRRVLHATASATRIAVRERRRAAVRRDVDDRGSKAACIGEEDVAADVAVDDLSRVAVPVGANERQRPVERPAECTILRGAVRPRRVGRPRPKRRGRRSPTGSCGHARRRATERAPPQAFGGTRRRQRCDRRTARAGVRAFQPAAGTPTVDSVRTIGRRDRAADPELRTVGDARAGRRARRLRARRPPASTRSSRRATWFPVHRTGGSAPRRCRRTRRRLRPAVLHVGRRE